MTKVKAIQYPFAMDEVGNTVGINDVSPGKEYRCIGCGQPMHLRKGKIYQAHFAHVSDSHTCSPESVFHKLAKKTIKIGIETAVTEQTEYPLSWRCSKCGLLHTGNLAITPRK